MIKDGDLEFILIIIKINMKGFGAPGFFRMAYCIETEKVERAMERLRKFVNEVYKK